MWRFIWNTIIRGLIILIPVVVLYVTLRELIELIPVSLDEYSIALTHFGLGLSDSLNKPRSN